MSVKILATKRQMAQFRKLKQLKRQQVRIKFDKESGLPYFSVPKDAPPITEEWIKQQLSDFP